MSFLHRAAARAVLCCCSITSFLALHAQEPGACSPAFCTENALLIERTCRDVLPDNDRIWIGAEADGGEACWCTCASLSALTIRQVDTMRAGETLRWKQRVAQVLGTRARARELRPLRRRTRTVLSLDTARTRVPAVRQQSGARLYHVLGRWVTMDQLVDRVYERFPIFNITYDAYEGSLYTMVSNDSNLDAARTWRSSDGPIPPEQRITIDVPHALLDDPAVDGELILFLLLHEVGHALGEVSQCMPGWPMVCEGDADHWAASVGLRRVFPGARFANVSLAAQQQLRAYATSIDSEYLSCGWCIGCDDSNCGYPPLDCRLNTIRAGRTLRPEPDCVDHWFRGQPSDCRYPDDGCR